MPDLDFDRNSNRFVLLLWIKGKSPESS